MPGLGTSFGRGGATTALMDLENADCVLIQGSSMAEAHPVGFRWVTRARERGATVIHVDPRFSRTSALADLWIPLRVGTDLAFLGGLIRWVMEHDAVFRDYVVHYTNAPVIVGEEYGDPEDLEGLFSGWDPDAGSYDPASWRYDGPGARPGDRPRERAVAGGRARVDPTLEHPRCVYQLLRRHFERYTPEMVERVCGVPRESFERVARALAEASGPERTAAICYAVGWTQHSKGVQVIRAAAVLQLLLGNVGRPGGGIMALRGHASIQGSTDIPTLYDILPGYLPMPEAVDGTDDLDAYLQRHGCDLGWWAHTDAYLVSLLRAWYGVAATADEDRGFGLLPRITGDHSHFVTFTEMADGNVEGLFVMGQNPAVGAQHARLERRALAELDWLVVRDLVETETAAFWYDSPEVERGELRTEEIGTEVFLFPAAGHAEKEGTFTNTQRLLQWRDKAVDPPGDARSEAWFIVHLGRRLKELAEAEGDPRDEALRSLTWDYPLEGPLQEPEIESVVREINGYRVDAGGERGELVTGFTELRADGSTACGCWIYSGVYPEEGRNRAAERDPRGPYGHGWGFAWPADRRILYNRASADPSGRPWSERKRLVWWDPERGRWTGLDTPDFPADKAPDYRPPGEDGARGIDAHPGTAPFLMQPDGLGWLYVPWGLKDGPLPTHYEPVESPSSNLLYPGQPANPAVRRFEREDNPLADSPDPRFPYALTTYRLTEHHTAGGMSRWLHRLAELQPDMFCELSPELAADVGVEHGEWVTVRTLRGAIAARALVTRRIRPLWIEGRPLHQVAMPFHWGRRGIVRGDAANDLIPLLGEPNVTIHESKALLCDLVPGRPGEAREDADATGTAARRGDPRRRGGRGEGER